MSDAAATGGAGRGAPGPGLFVYGTLCDDDVRALVLGALYRSVQLAPARLRDFRTVYAAGRLYPLIQPRRGAAVDGVLLFGLSDPDYARLDAFEGADYRRERQHVWPQAAGGSDAEPALAWLYRPSGALAASFKQWRLAEWQARDKPLFLRQVKVWLAGRRAAAS